VVGRLLERLGVDEPEPAVEGRVAEPVLFEDVAAVQKRASRLVPRASQLLRTMNGAMKAVSCTRSRELGLLLHSV